jgi:hypothetical protein
LFVVQGGKPAAAPSVAARPPAVNPAPAAPPPVEQRAGNEQGQAPEMEPANRRGRGSPSEGGSGVRRYRGRSRTPTEDEE